MLTRYPDWERRLSGYLVVNAHRAFRYGEFDCCLFAAGSALAMTGVDLAAPFRGRYASRAEARERLTEATGSASIERLMAAVADQFDLERVSPSRANRGDIALIRRRREYSLGIVNLSGLDLVMPFARGLMRVEKKHASVAWRI